jgi:acyl carrier protein
MQQIIEKLKPILIKYTFEKGLVENVNEKTLILKDLKINSARIIDIILDVEEEFEIEIDDVSMEQIITLGDLAGLIRMKIS